jgi:hypothetical protein
MEPGQEFKQVFWKIAILTSEARKGLSIEVLKSSLG